MALSTITIGDLSKIRLDKVLDVQERLRTDPRVREVMMRFAFGTHQIDRCSFYFGALVAMGVDITEAYAAALDVAEIPVLVKNDGGKVVAVANEKLPWRHKDATAAARRIQREIGLAKRPRRASSRRPKS